MTGRPGMPFPEVVVDAHHHLYVRPGLSYLADAYLADLRASGIGYRASILVQARMGYRPDGPEALRPLGETEFALAQAARGAALGFPGLCLGIVGAADLSMGRAVRPVIEGHLALAGHARQGGRFCSIRHVLAWDADPGLLNPAYPTTAYLMHDPQFRAGLQVLADLDLAFDAWVLAPQLPDLLRLAQQMPGLRIVLNHCGGPVGSGRWAHRRAEMFDLWAAGTAALATCPNVAVKLGGLGMALGGLRPDPAAADPGAALAQLWQPWTDHLLDRFGPGRLMLESNAPADRALYGFGAGQAVFGRLLTTLTPAERQAICAGTALSTYGLVLPDPDLTPDRRPPT